MVALTLNNESLQTKLVVKYTHAWLPVQWNPSNADTNGTHSAVRNIEASVFRRLPVIFPVGVAVSIHHAMAALATQMVRFYGSGLLRRLCRG